MYRHRVVMGTYKNGEGPLDSTKEIKKTFIKSMGPSQQSVMEEGVELNEEIPIDDPNYVAKHKEMFWECNAESRGVYFREEYLDFGFSQSGIKSEPREVTLVNTLNYDVKVNWVIPSLPASAAKVNYLVNPVSFDMPKQSEKIIKIFFAPSETNVYYFHRLQCYAFRKTGFENKFRQIDTEDPTKRNTHDVTLTRTTLTLSKYKKKTAIEVAEEVEPPMCLTLPVVGHSFPPGSQPFLPMLEFTPSNIVQFLPAALEESAYQMVQLVNNSDTPIFYKMLPDPSRTFRIFPPLGLIEGKSFALICFEFSPKISQSYSFITQCLLNHSASFQTKLQLVGFCYVPTISLEGESKIYYPPTFMGVASKEKLKVKNDSLVQCDVSCVIPEKYKEEITFFPQTFRLRGNEIREVACTFIPKKPQPYTVTAKLLASGVYDPYKDLVGFFNPSSGNLIKQGSMRQKTARTKEIVILGAGADGYIEISPEKVDYGTVIIHFSKPSPIR